MNNTSKWVTPELILMLAVSVAGAWTVCAASVPVDSPKKTPRSGTYIHAVYFASYSCGVCASDRNIEAVRRALDLLRKRAAIEGKEFYSTGVALNTDIDKSLAYLRSVAVFDELSIGMSWFNSTALHYVWSEKGTITGTPQFFVFEEKIEYVDKRVSVSNRRVRAKVWGTGIAYWARDGEDLVLDE
jgi:hypothetical protein